MTSFRAESKRPLPTCSTTRAERWTRGPSGIDAACPSSEDGDWLGAGEPDALARSSAGCGDEETLAARPAAGREALAPPLPNPQAATVARPASERSTRRSLLRFMA